MRDILKIGLETLIEHSYIGLRELTLVAFTDEEQKDLVAIAKTLLEPVENSTS